MTLQSWFGDRLQKSFLKIAGKNDPLEFTIHHVRAVALACEIVE